jgi:RNA polymerase sigma factor (TIGR02999 family)
MAPLSLYWVKKRGRQRMSDRSTATPTVLLAQWRAGKKEALDELLPLVYHELHRAAQRQLRSERAGHTLQATALIHEVYLRLAGGDSEGARDRHHFVALTSHLMREILVDHARARMAQKRSGGVRVALTDDVAFTENHESDVIAVDSVLGKLAELDAQQARIVELRYFGGLSIRETSAALGVSMATVKRDWETARLWLQQQVQPADVS